MPELPEVETVTRGLRPVMENNRFVRVEQRRDNLRIPFPQKFMERLEGRKIVSMWRRAKYILVQLDSSEVLLMHLGMSGRFTIDVPDVDPKEGRTSRPGDFHTRIKSLPESIHDHVVFHMSNGATITYTDPRRFGLMTLINTKELQDHRLLKNIGIEPLGNALSGEFLVSCFAGRKVNLKAALLDQKNIAGLGNIYVCEALFRSQLSPLRLAATLARPKAAGARRAKALAIAIRSVLNDAMAAGGSSLNDYAQTNGELGYFQHSFDVYDRENSPCRREKCTGKIKRITQSGRSSFYCPKCQR